MRRILCRDEVTFRCIVEMKGLILTDSTAVMRKLHESRVSRRTTHEGPSDAHTLTLECIEGISDEQHGDNIGLVGKYHNCRSSVIPRTGLIGLPRDVDICCQWAERRIFYAGKGIEIVVTGTRSRDLQLCGAASIAVGQTILNVMRNLFP